MAGSSCVNGIPEGSNNYSSPVPVIGLYIAAGTLVCLLLMLYDIVTGFRRRQRWVPCFLFTLNSVTLTLISIATKITVDLTTPMPGVPDQLSKLTGTVLICIFMGFISPSVASGGSQWISNIASLSILVITVVVNICIQIGTGVIHLFVPEHIIIMCCMLVILLLLWFCAYETNFDFEFTLYKDMIRKGHKRYFKDGKADTTTSMFERVKNCYMLAFAEISQLVICKNINHSTIMGFCIICFLVLIEALVRCLVLTKSKFCGGKSDYDWSMLIIVIIQILTIGLGCFATSFRWFALFPQLSFQFSLKNKEEDISDTLIRENSFLGTLWQKVGLYLGHYAWYIVLLARMLVMFPARTAHKTFGGSIDEDFSEKWSDRRLVGNMNIIRWSIQFKKTEPLKYLSLIFSRISQSHQLYSRKLDNHEDIHPIKFEASHREIVFLVRLASFCFPSEMTEILTHSLDEVFHILDFVDARIRPEDRWKRRNSKLAEAAFVADGFHSHFSAVCDGQEYQSLSPLGRALFRFNLVQGLKVCHGTTNLIKRYRQFESVDEFYEVIEQMYVDMLHFYLVQLPKAIFKYIDESPEEECELRARRALKMLLKIQPLESEVEWFLPEATGITNFISHKGHQTDTPVLEQAPVPASASSDVIQTDVSTVAEDVTVELC